MSWSSLLKATFKYGGRAAKATASSVGSAVIHPQRTIKGLGTATKTAAVGGAAACQRVFVHQSAVCAAASGGGAHFAQKAVRKTDGICREDCGL